MSTAVYKKSSPYSGTPMWGNFLDIWAGKQIYTDVTDALYQIDSIYNNRPDLLSFDLYGDTGYWWVFAVRNPNELTDPLMSFTTGKVIYIPTLATIKRSLGI